MKKQKTKNQSFIPYNELIDKGDFSDSELDRADRLLKHIEKFESPVREHELVKWIVSNNIPAIAHAA